MARDRVALIATLCANNVRDRTEDRTLDRQSLNAILSPTAHRTQSARVTPVHSVQFCRRREQQQHKMAFNYSDNRGSQNPVAQISGPVAWGTLVNPSASPSSPEHNYTSHCVPGGCCVLNDVCVLHLLAPLLLLLRSSLRLALDSNWPCKMSDYNLGRLLYCSSSSFISNALSLKLEHRELARQFCNFAMVS